MSKEYLQWGQGIADFTYRIVPQRIFMTKRYEMKIFQHLKLSYWQESY